MQAPLKLNYTALLWVLQLVVELVAAGNPMLFSAEEWTYSEDSFRTGTYKCSGTVFNPKLEREVRKRPVPPPPPMHLDLLDEKGTFYSDKEYRERDDGHEEVANNASILASIRSCLFCT